MGYGDFWGIPTDALSGNHLEVMVFGVGKKTVGSKMRTDAECVCMYVCEYMCMENPKGITVCMYVFMYVCMYIFMYACILCVTCV